MRVKLTVSQGSNEGKSFDVNVPQFVIGRAKGCQLRPQSDAISRQHCVICVTEDSATIRDLGSRNGTVVNGEKIEGTYTFVNGDELRVGPLHLTVSIGADVKPVAPSDTETLSASRDETQTLKAPKSTPDPMPTQSMPVAKKGPADISDSGDISDWLDEEDNTDDTQIRKSQTRQFRLDESEAIEVQKAAAKEEEEIDLTAKQKTTSKKKKEYGKLPERKKSETADSREAAESTLRQMFNKGL